MLEFAMIGAPGAIPELLQSLGDRLRKMAEQSFTIRHELQGLETPN